MRLKGFQHPARAAVDGVDGGTAKTLPAGAAVEGGTETTENPSRHIVGGDEATVVRTDDSNGNPVFEGGEDGRNEGAAITAGSDGNGMSTECNLAGKYVPDLDGSNCRENNLEVSENRVDYNAVLGTSPEQVGAVSIKKTRFRYKMPAIYADYLKEAVLSDMTMKRGEARSKMIVSFGFEEKQLPVDLPSEDQVKTRVSGLKYTHSKGKERKQKLRKNNGNERTGGFEGEA